MHLDPDQPYDLFRQKEKHHYILKQNHLPEERLTNQTQPSSRRLLLHTVIQIPPYLQYSHQTRYRSPYT